MSSQDSSAKRVNKAHDDKHSMVTELANKLDGILNLQDSEDVDHSTTYAARKTLTPKYNQT